MTEPTPLQLLVLRAALCPPAEAAVAWRRARELTPELTALDDRTARLLPRVYLNLRDTGMDELLDGPRDAHRHAGFTNGGLFDRVAEPLRGLEAAGVPTIVFKGASICTRYAHDDGARPMADVDVLVRPEDVGAADRQLEAQGWARRKSPGQPVESVMRLKHSAPYRGPNGSEIDLHWSPLHEPVDVQSFWDGAVAGRLAAAETCTLDAADELLVTCAHGLRGGSSAVRWMADASVVIAASGSDLRWDRLVEGAERFRLSARVERALRLLRRHFAVAVPTAALDGLATARRPVHERVTERVLAGAPPRGRLTTLNWDRYRRLRALGAPGGDATFLRYLRELSGAPTWRDFAAGYGRTLRRRRADAPQDLPSPAQPV